MDFLFRPRDSTSTAAQELQTMTTLYLITVFELRADTQKYMFSIDTRAHKSLDKANERLALLSRCNTIVSAQETLRGGQDPDTGCQWCSWAARSAEAGKPRFFAEVRKVVLQGAVQPRNDGAGETIVEGVGEGLAGKEEARESLEFKKDRADSVWVVAVCRSLGAKGEVGVAVGDEKPRGLAWAVNGVVASQGQAVARAARIWSNTILRDSGPFEMLNFHYGQARWVLLPLTMSEDNLPRAGTGSSELHRDLASNGPQIRLERVEVMGEEGLLDVGLPPQAVLYEKPFRALRSETQKTEAEMRRLGEAAGEVL